MNEIESMKLTKDYKKEDICEFNRQVKLALLSIKKIYIKVPEDFYSDIQFTV